MPSPNTHQNSTGTHWCWEVSSNFDLARDAKEAVRVPGVEWPDRDKQGRPSPFYRNWWSITDVVNYRQFSKTKGRPMTDTIDAWIHRLANWYKVHIYTTILFRTMKECLHTWMAGLEDAQEWLRSATDHIRIIWRHPLNNETMYSPDETCDLLYNRIHFRSLFVAGFADIQSCEHSGHSHE